MTTLYISRLVNLAEQSAEANASAFDAASSALVATLTGQVTPLTFTAGEWHGTSGDNGELWRRRVPRVGFRRTDVDHLHLLEPLRRIRDPGLQQMRSFAYLEPGTFGIIGGAYRVGSRKRS